MCTLSHVSLTVSAQLNELFVFTVAAFIFVVDCVYDWRCHWMHQEILTCLASSNLIPEIWRPTTAADGRVSRLKSQQLTSHKPKQRCLLVSKRSWDNYLTCSFQDDDNCRWSLDDFVWLWWNHSHSKPKPPIDGREKDIKNHGSFLRCNLMNQYN